MSVFDFYWVPLHLERETLFDLDAWPLSLSSRAVKIKNDLEVSLFRLAAPLC